MRVTKSLTIEVTGVLTVTVTPSPSKGYLGTSFKAAVNWTPAYGLGWVDTDWGDGRTESDLVYPPYTLSHKYASVGTYTIRVTVTDDMTFAMGSGSASVTVVADLLVSFAVDKKVGDAPLAVIFTYSMSGGYTPYVWILDYGNGVTEDNPTSPRSHTYSTKGTYVAKLTVTDAMGATAVRALNIFAGAVSAWEQIKAKWDALTTQQKALAVAGLLGGVAGGVYVARR